MQEEDEMAEPERNERDWRQHTKYQLLWNI